MITFAIVRTSFITAAMIAATALSSSPVFAQDLETTSVMISTAGIDLASPAGQRAVHRRVHTAANQVCGVEPSSRDLAQRSFQSRCVAIAMKSADVQLAAMNTNSDVRVAIIDPVSNIVPASKR